MNLVKRNFGCLVDFELKDIDMVSIADYSVNTSVVRAGFRFHSHPDQEEHRVEKQLKTSFRVCCNVCAQ